MKSLFGARGVHLVVAVLTSTLLAACGGGGGAPLPSNVAPTSGATITMSLGSSTSLSAATPLTVKALVLDKNKSPAANVVVTFSVNAGVGSLSPSSGTAVTDSTGTATITVNAVSTTVGGAATVQANAIVGTEAVSASIGYAFLAGAASSGAKISLALLNAQGATTNLTAAAPITVRATVTDKNSKPAANVIVTFSTAATIGNFSPAAGTALTDATGVAFITLNAVDATVGGATKLSATATIDGAATTADVNYAVTAITTTAGAKLTVALTNAQGGAANALSNSSPLTVKAAVFNKNGIGVPNAIVRFGTDNTLGILSPSSGTALTDANGLAQVVMLPASLAASGAATITATAIIDGVTVSNGANYSVGATALSLSPVRLTFADGTTGGSLPAYGTMTVAVDVLAGADKFTNSLNVAFASTCVTAGKATLAALVPTNNGTAQAVYRDLGCAQSDAISASIAGVAGARTTSFAIDLPAAAAVQFVSVSPTTLVTFGAGGGGRSEVATFRFKVIDVLGNPLSLQKVTFSAISASQVTLNKTTEFSDAGGLVNVSVNSGLVPSTLRVRAQVNNVSTISDQVVITSGLTAQKSFTINASATNIEAFSFDNVNSTISVLVADPSGNPVIDGTPILFQTNLGLIDGICNTVNSGCSATFRSQNPRVATTASNTTACNSSVTSGASADVLRPGLATICVSTTDSFSSVFGKVRLFMSGSTASTVYLDGNNASALSGTTVLASFISNASKVFTLQINDVNGNPMPAATTVTVSDLSNISTVSISPSTVASIAPAASIASSGPAGSNHVFTMASNIGACTSGDISTASFNVVVTTPRGVVTKYPFVVSIICN